MSGISYCAAGPSTWPTEAEARQALTRVVAAVVKAQGYDSIESSAMAYIVNNLESLLLSLPTHAHELAMMANRRVPSTRDFYLALQQSGPRLRQNDLEQYLRDVDADPLSWDLEPDCAVISQEWSDPYKDCLPSESEDDSAVEEKSLVIATRSKTTSSTSIRKRRRKRFRPDMAEVPSHLPNLPPKHTWLSTPSYPAHSITLQPPLAFLDLKVSSNRRMEASLRGLIRATDAAILDSQKNKQGHTSTNPRRIVS